MARSTSGLRQTKLEQKAWAAGAPLSFATSSLIPPHRRVLKVDLVVRGSFTQPAAPTSQKGVALFQMLSNIKHGRKISIDGLGLHNLNWLRYARETSLCADLPNTPNAVFNREVKFTIPFHDPTSRSPWDGSMASELFGEYPIEIQCSAASIFGGTAPTTSLVVDAIVTHDEAQVGEDEDSVVAPASMVMMSQQFSALDAIVEKAGAWLYGCIYRVASNDTGSMTSTQISSIDTFVDGEVAAKSMRAIDMVHDFNSIRALGSVKRETGNVNAQAGCLINADPGDGDADGAVVTMEFVPVVYPPRDYYLSNQVPHAEKSFRATLSGTATTYNLAYVLYEGTSESEHNNAARKLGLSGPIEWSPKTASKTNLGGRALGAWGKFLPTRIRRKRGVNL